MVLEYVNNAYGANCAEISIEEIAKIVRVHDLGTTFSDVGRINSKLQCAKEVRFIVKNRPREFQDIETEIVSRRPVIAYILQEDQGVNFGHAVVIKGYDREAVTITYNDPQLGEKTEPISRFMAKWEGKYRLLILISVGKERQTQLPEFPA